MLDLVGNPEDRFSRDVAKFSSVLRKLSLGFLISVDIDLLAQLQRLASGLKIWL